jgi:hypothetical protein
MASHTEIDANELFRFDNSMAIVVAQPKPLAIIPVKDLIVMLPNEIVPSHP